MASLLILARLFAGEDQPLANQLVNIESFDLSERRWRAVAEAQSNREGVLKASLDLLQIDMGKVGPALRLVEDGGQKRVIAAGAMLEMQPRARNLLADFGEIEVLGDAAFPRLNSEGEERETVAGVTRRKGLSQAAIIGSGAGSPDPGAVVAGEPAQPVRSDAAREALVRAGLDPKVSAELETMHAINLDNAARLSEKDRLLATREHELTLKSNELQQALARASDAESKLAEAQTASRGQAAEIDAVVSNIGTKIGAASTTLKASANPFRIGAIKLDLKGSLADDGRIFLGGDNPDGSGFSIEMSPEGDTVRGEVQVTVPDVTGLTRSAARRVLRSVGLRLTAATQAMAAGSATHGHSLRQTPSAGSAASHGGDVLVVFANVSEAQGQ